MDVAKCLLYSDALCFMVRPFWITPTKLPVLGAPGYGVIARSCR
jgi:hypothetical protein